jgi:hypothetical protein
MSAADGRWGLVADAIVLALVGVTVLRYGLASSSFLKERGESKRLGDWVGLGRAA